MGRKRENSLTVDDSCEDGITRARFPKRVEVLDGTHGNVIGYRDRKEVFKLVRNDVRFVPSTDRGVIRLLYVPRAVLAGMTVLCDSFSLYVRYILTHQKTAVGCDDKAKRWFQVSFILNSKAQVVALPLKRAVYAEMAKCPREMRKALEKGTAGLIKYLVKQHRDQLRRSYRSEPFGPRGR